MRGIVVIHLTGTDGDYVLRVFDSMPEVKEYLKRNPMHWEDYAVIEGTVLKNFNQKREL